MSFALLDRVRERTASDLSDGELLAMIAGINAELDDRFGPADQMTVDIGDPGDASTRQWSSLRLVIPADPAAPMTVIEIDPGNIAGPVAERELDPADYRLLHGGRTLQRLTSGPNARQYWAPLVRVTYLPMANRPARDEVVIKLIQLDLSYRGALRSEKAGDYGFTLSGDMAADREAILKTLLDRRGMVMA